MSDQQKAIKKVMGFLQDDTKKTLLIKGYDDDAKVRVALSCLNKLFNKGIIRTNSMMDISSHVNKAFTDDKLPSNVTSTKTYRIGKIKVNISSYARHSKNNPKGSDNTFTLFFPVQSVLQEYKRYNGFLRELKETRSKKIIIITTNDQGIAEWDIDNHVDESFFYSVENDNPQLMKNLRMNGAI